MRPFTLCLISLLAACRGEHLSSVTDGLLLPDAVDCGDVFVGETATCALSIDNRAKSSVTLELTTDGAFSVDQPRVVLGGGEHLEVTVQFRPTGVGAMTSSLGVSGRAVALLGVGREVPRCESTTDCRVLRFDPAVGACVEQVAADGAGCGGQNRCLVGGVCRAGVCVGAARSCDDGDACTTDACDATRGCVHEAVACAASTNPCEAALCDPATGCRQEPVIDGTACGANDCVTAHVCLAGQCVAREAPMGSTCSEPTACRGAGRCSAPGVCERPAPGQPVEAWRFVLPPTRWLQSSAVSEAGNVYLLHGNQAGAMLPGDVVFTSLDRDGRRRFEVNLTAEDPGVEYGTNALVDERHQRVFVVTRTYSPTEPLPHVLVLSARDTLTGALLWKRDLGALNIPALYPASNGALVLSVMKLVSIGDGDVLAELSEGESIHQQHLVAFAGATGVERWRVQRAGHGALAVSGAGELWLGWAACWSFDYRLSRFDAAGQQVVERQLPMNPLAMSDTAALVPFDGGLGLLEGDLSTVRALPLPRNHRPSTYSGIAWSGDEVTTVTDGPTPALVRVDVDAGAVLWATPTDPAATWRTLRLVADGGTAVTLTFRDGGTGLALYRNDGALSEQCDLGAFATSELAAQRLFGTGGGAFIAYDLPGVFAAPSGWTGSGGRLGTQRP